MPPHLRPAYVLLIAILLCGVAGCGSALLDPPPFEPNLSVTPGMSLYQDNRGIGSAFTRTDGTRVCQASLRYLLTAWHRDELLVFEDSFPTGDYYVAFHPGFSESDAAKAAAVEKALRIRLVDDTRPVEVPVLRLLPGVSPPRSKQAGLPDIRTEHGPSMTIGQVTTSTVVHVLTNHSTADLAKWLQGARTLPVIDETGLDGRFDFKIVEITKYRPAPLFSCDPMVEQHLDLKGVGFELQRLPRPLKATFVSMER